MIYSGMGPDYRLLVRRARKIAQQYQLIYSDPIPTTQLVQRVAQIMQEYTQSGGVRPFGVSLLICGWDNGRPYLFQCDPSVCFRMYSIWTVNFSMLEIAGRLLCLESYCSRQKSRQWQVIPRKEVSICLISFLLYSNIDFVCVTDTVKISSLRMLFKLQF